jgi:hypothetical protein
MFRSQSSQRAATRKLLSFGIALLILAGSSGLQSAAAKTSAHDSDQRL